MNNSNQVRLPPIQALLYHHKPLHILGIDSHKKNSSSFFAPYPPVPDSKQYENNRAHGHCYRYSQNQGSQNYYHNNNYYYKQHVSPYRRQRNLKLGATTTPSVSTGYLKLDETTTITTRSSSAVPLLQEQNTLHSRSFSDQSCLRRSSASEDIPSGRLLLYPTSPQSTTSSFHRRAASDVPSSSNRERRTSSSNSSDVCLNEQQGLPGKMINMNRYGCNACFKTFSRPSSLRIHVLSHTGEKPHVCPQPDCGRRFSVQSNMRRHLKVHYCDNPPTLQRQQQQRPFSSRLRQF